jgi:hypothetical protein
MSGILVVWCLFWLVYLHMMLEKASVSVHHSTRHACYRCCSTLSRCSSILSRCPCILSWHVIQSPPRCREVTLSAFSSRPSAPYLGLSERRGLVLVPQPVCPFRGHLTTGYPSLGNPSSCCVWRPSDCWPQWRGASCIPPAATGAVVATE